MAIESLTGNTINISSFTKPVAKDKTSLDRQTGASGTTESASVAGVLSQDVHTALTAGAVAPVIDQNRVAALKLAIQSGAYKPNAERIANKMLQFEAKLPNST